MVRRSIKNYISMLLPLAFSAGAQADPSVWQITDTYSIPLAANARERLQTEYFSLGQWNVATAVTNLYHDVWLYPTAQDKNPAGVFIIESNKIGLGDFNGDGRQDVLVNWVTFPHVLDRPPIMPSVFLNTGGALKLANDILVSDSSARINTYQVAVADFNLDGVDDAVMGSMGVITRLPEGGYRTIPERIPLAISQSEGLADFSAQIQGQENGVINSFSFAHDLAVGDLNSDGFPDFYQGRHLFIGDGKGAFFLRNDLIPQKARPGGGHYLMSSAIGDLDNDGVDDLVFGLADGQPAGSAESGWIFLSNGAPNLSNAKMLPLPPGLYGLENTKHNWMKLADLDGDGRLDIIIGQTKSEPYYSGRQLQVLMNQGGGVFTDESAVRVSDGIRPQAWGEGMNFVMDVNGDGYPDIIDQTGAGGLVVLINDGTGVFERMPMSLLPIVQNHHLQEFAEWEGKSWSNTRTLYVYPMDIDGNGVASFLVQLSLPSARFPIQQGDFSRTVLYTITPKKPYKPVPGAPMLSDQECLFQWAESVDPQLLADRGVVTARLGAVNYRYYGSTNTYLGFRANRVLLYRPAQSDDILDLGGVYEYLPLARAARCQ